MHPIRPFALQTALRYLAAGRLLHLITTGQLAVLFLLAWQWNAGGGLQTMVLVLLGLLVLFTQLDARSRYQEYKKVRAQLLRHGADARIFRSLSRSRCQRDAVEAASRQLGHGRACREWFAKTGYRWYHLLPDFVRDHPGYLFSWTFLQATFFAPTYRPCETKRRGCRRASEGVAHRLRLKSMAS